MSTVTAKQFAGLGTRQDFNQTLRHLVNVTMMVEEVVKGKNPADLLSDALDAQSITREQIDPILSIILKEKLSLPVKSHNMVESFSTFQPMIKAFSRWNAIDIVLVYHHPNLGVIVGNPANPEHWESFPELKKDELIVVYARSKKSDREIAKKGLAAFFDIISGRLPDEDPAFIMEVPKAAEVKAAPVAAPAAQPAQAPAAAASAAPAKKTAKNLSPRYSVQVTNELFHNGNVEAWKNIIESYQVKTKNKVIVFHEGELIQDLNSLFKWGKVKHGGVIHFQVMGEEIKMVSRLQKYLYEGASARFESFLKQDISRVLNIF